MTKRLSRTAVFATLGVVLVCAALVSAAVGQYGIGVGDVLASIGHRLGLGPDIADPFASATLWQVRFPRVALTIIVGAVLGVGGAVLQGVFGNPLADPGIIGVSSGAAVGAATAIVAGWTFVSSFTVAGAAFVGAIIAAVTVYIVSRAGGRTEVVTLILTGIAVNAVGGALLALLMFFGSQQAREQLIFWQLGSMAGSRWPYVLVAAPLAIAGIVVSCSLARRLDLLALGERPARHLGVDVERLRFVSIAVVSLMTAAAVSFCGIIGFVGLVVPHLIRMLAGPAHPLLLPASALGGAALLTIADIGARTLVPFGDLPIGALTSAVGGPFFFWLLRRSRNTAGGWA